MSMYVRIKRHKTTVFLQVEPTDSVLDVKAKLQALLEQPPDKLALHKESREGVWEPLADAKTLAELEVENDAVLGMTYARGDGSGWEDVRILEPHADDEEVEEAAGAAAATSRPEGGA